MAIIQTGTAVIANAGTIEASIYLGGSSTPAGLTLNNTDTGRLSAIVSDAAGGTNLIDLTNRAANGDTNAQSNDLNGAVLATTGTTDINVEIQSYIFNNGLVAVANFQAPDTINLYEGGYFGNDGELLAAGQGTFNVYSGDRSPYPNITNTGLIEAADGGAFNMIGVGPVGQGQYLGNASNSGLILANDGSVTADANVIQTTTGTMKMINDSTLSLDGTLDGGTLILSNSTLDFGLSGAIGFIGDSNAPTLDLDGNTDTLNFAQPVSEDFTSATDMLSIYSSYSGQDPIATYNLGGPTAYSSTDFTSSGSTVTFTAHPTTTS